MMSEEAMKQMHQLMGAQGKVLASPLAQGAVMAATGYAAGRGLLGSALTRNPLMVFGAGILAGYFLHKYEKDIVLAFAKASGMGRDFAMQQKENLADLMAEAQETEKAQAAGAAAAQTPST